MARLYRLRAAHSEITELFQCDMPKDLRWKSFLWPGVEALVIELQGKARIARLMHWGMPAPSGSRQPLRWAERNPWSRLAFHRDAEPPGRCLIPLDSFALPDGQKRRRTRSWFGLWDEPIFAWAGLSRHYEGIGPCFLGALTRANPLVARVGETMPLILRKEDYTPWLESDRDCVLRIWRTPPVAEGAMWLEQTDELWSRSGDLSDLDQGQRTQASAP